MKFLPFIPIFLSLLTSVEVASGDTVFLKDGTAKEGLIIRENDEAYTLEIQVTKTIKDERVILKKDVERVERVSPDNIAFEELEGLVPTPDLLNASEYEARIGRLEAFREEFPESGKSELAAEMLGTLKRELEVVLGGGLKLDGELILAEQYEANAYEYDSLVMAARIDDAVSHRNFIEAIREFASYDEKFKFAAGREALAERMMQVLRVYKLRLEQSLAGYAGRLEDREKGLAQMSVEDRADTLRAIEEKNALIEARYQREKSDKLILVTPYALHEASLKEAIGQVEGEFRRLETSMKEGVKGQAPELAPEVAYRDAWQSLPGASDEEKKKILSDLASQKMPQVYLEKLEKRAAQAVEPTEK